MGSISKDIRLKQLSDVEAVFQSRVDTLKKAGITEEKAMGKDPMYRKAKADLKRARKRIIAIDARVTEVEKAKVTKAAAVEAKKEAASKPKEAKAPAKPKKPKAEKPK